MRIIIIHEHVICGRFINEILLQQHFALKIVVKNRAVSHHLNQNMNHHQPDIFPEIIALLPLLGTPSNCYFARNPRKTKKFTKELK